MERDEYEQRILLSFHENDSRSLVSLEYPTWSTNKEIEERQTPRSTRLSRSALDVGVVQPLSRYRSLRRFDGRHNCDVGTEFKTTSRQRQTPRRARARRYLRFLVPIGRSTDLPTGRGRGRPNRF